MNVNRITRSTLAIAMLFAGSAAADQFSVINSNAGPSAGTSPPPLIEIVVYDGTTLPATVIAGCSEPDCMGLSDGTDPTPGTGSVTHSKNYVGWSVAGGTLNGTTYLYVDGRKVSSARSTRLLVWSTSSKGAHVLQALAYSPDGVAGWSAPLTITAQ